MKKRLDQSRKLAIVLAATSLFRSIDDNLIPARVDLAPKDDVPNIFYVPNHYYIYVNERMLNEH